MVVVTAAVLRVSSPAGRIDETCFDRLSGEGRTRTRNGGDRGFRSRRREENTDGTQAGSVAVAASASSSRHFHLLFLLHIIRAPILISLRRMIGEENFRGSQPGRLDPTRCCLFPRNAENIHSAEEKFSEAERKLVKETSISPVKRPTNQPSKPKKHDPPTHLY